MKQIYKITYPTGKIYIGKDSVGSFRYIGSPDMATVNADFECLPDQTKKDYSIRKQILWESENCTEEELSKKEVEFIRVFKSNDPSIGYNRWPKFNGSTNALESAADRPVAGTPEIHPNAVHRTE